MATPLFMADFIIRSKSLVIDNVAFAQAKVAQILKAKHSPTDCRRIALPKEWGKFFAEIGR